MDIYIIDHNAQMLKPFYRLFADAPDVTIVCSDFEEFIQENEVECLVSPANSYGLMDGGYDLALTRWFGQQMMDRVQEYIIRHFHGEQILGTSFLVEAEENGQSLIHTPTMRYPMLISDPSIVYQCMRSCLICAKEHGVESILIPLFGGGVGGLEPEVIADMMYRAYTQLRHPPRQITWDYVDTQRF